MFYSSIHSSLLTSPSPQRWNMCLSVSSGVPGAASSILWQEVWGESAGGCRLMCGTSPPACMMLSAGKAAAMTSNPTCSNDLVQGFWLSKGSVFSLFLFVTVCLICECMEEQLPHSGPFNPLELKILFWLTWNIWGPKYPQKPPLTELQTYFLVECTRKYVLNSSERIQARLKQC